MKRIIYDNLDFLQMLVLCKLSDYKKLVSIATTQQLLAIKACVEHEQFGTLRPHKTTNKFVFSVLKANWKRNCLYKYRSSARYVVSKVIVYKLKDSLRESDGFLFDY